MAKKQTSEGAKQFEKARLAWNREARRFGGVHPHRAQEVIIQAADEEAKAKRAPRYLIDLRDCLNRLFPKKYE
jgi:hypothetical protein